MATVGSPGFRALPVPACRRLRPRWTRVRARLNARSLLPSPPLHTGRRPRCSGFRGWSRSVPPLAAFGPQSSCLRFAQAVTGLDARLGPSDPMACRVAGGTSYATPGHRSPTGKRRLGPAHATSPLTALVAFPARDSCVALTSAPPHIREDPVVEVFSGEFGWRRYLLW